jgi:hypothetical protein
LFGHPEEPEELAKEFAEEGATEEQYSAGSIRDPNLPA